MAFRIQNLQLIKHIIYWLIVLLIKYTIYLLNTLIFSVDTKNVFFIFVLHIYFLLNFHRIFLYNSKFLYNFMQFLKFFYMNKNNLWTKIENCILDSNLKYKYFNESFKSRNINCIEIRIEIQFQIIIVQIILCFVHMIIKIQYLYHYMKNSLKNS